MVEWTGTTQGIRNGLVTGRSSSGLKRCVEKNDVVASVLPLCVCRWLFCLCDYLLSSFPQAIKCLERLFAALVGRCVSVRLLGGLRIECLGQC